MAASSVPAWKHLKSLKYSKRRNWLCRMRLRPQAKIQAAAYAVSESGKGAAEARHLAVEASAARPRTRARCV
jgi:hypothetical protein